MAVVVHAARWRALRGLGSSTLVRPRPGSLLATALARSTHALPGPACGGQAAKAKAAVDAGPAVPRGAAPEFAIWMQTTGAVLLAVKRCSLERVRLAAQDGPGAPGFLYFMLYAIRFSGECPHPRKSTAGHLSRPDNSPGISASRSGPTCPQPLLAVR